MGREILGLDDASDGLSCHGILSVRLRWTASHKLDFVGLDTNKPHTFAVSELPFVLAWHSNLGNVFELLESSDDECVELRPGETIFLFYKPLALHATVVDYMTVVEGRYYSFS